MRFLNGNERGGNTYELWVKYQHIAAGNYETTFCYKDVND